MKNTKANACVVIGILVAGFIGEPGETHAQPIEAIQKQALSLAGYPARANCDPVEPIITGSTNQGGYSFEYQSWRGKNCRVYRLCNKPGRELTPVLWKDKHEVFIDTSLVRCPARSTCQCAEVIKPTRQTYQSRSSLSYGINKDEYREAPPAYSEPEYQAAAPQHAFPLYVVVRGTVADAEGRPVLLGLGLASIVSLRRDRLIYQMTAAPESRNFDLIRKYPIQSGDLSLKWSGADSQAFQSYLASKGVSVVPANNQSIFVDISMQRNFVLRSELMTLSSAGKPIFSTTAPAYRPDEGWKLEK